MPNQSHSHRKQLILNMINHLGPISRTELIALTDYRPATVGAIIKELLEKQMILETGYQSAGHGRKRVMLEINKNRLCAIGISFTAKSVIYIVAQINGNILQKSESPIRPSQAKAELAKEITAHVRQLLAAFDGKDIVGIGICNPLYDPTSYQDNHSLSANYTHFNDWIHDGLKPMLEALFDGSVKTFSGVTLPALAEHRFGVAKGAQNFICVELSNGIGASIFCNGTAVAGANGVAGELGHTVIEYNSPVQKLCYCGKPGCVESSTAYPALAADIKAALDRGVFSVLNSYHDRASEITVQEIRRALDEEDRMCMYYVKEAAVRLGVVIANAVNLLNPELIILYGFMLELGDYFLQQLETSIRANVLSLSGNFEIRRSVSLETTMPLGAVAEIFSAYLKIDDYKWIYQLQRSDLEEKMELPGSIPD